MNGKDIKLTFPIQIKRKKPASFIPQIALGIILAVLVILPLIKMIFFIKAEDFSKVFNSNGFLTIVINTLETTLLSTLISIVLAYALAWAIKRVNIKFKKFFVAIFILPMLIPSISHGMGLIVLFGNNGIITNLLHLKTTVYGFNGIVLGSVLYSFPVAFLMIADVLEYEDYSAYEAADVLGIPKFRQFLSITLPYIRKPMISVIFATFTMIITDYGVPAAVGDNVTTLSLYLFNNVSNQFEYGKGSVVGLFLIIPALIAFLFDLLNKDKAKSSFVTRSFIIKKSTVKEIIAYVICGFVSLFTLSIILAFVIQAFTQSYPTNMAITLEHFNTAFISRHATKYLLNSLLIALITSLVGTLVAFITAYFTARVKTKYVKILHLISILSLAIPGLVLGLSYIITFKSSFIYGTFLIIIMANTVHFFASPYLMMYNALNKMNGNLEDVGSVLGVSRFRVVLDVIVPQSILTIIEMFSYFFVNSMMTISAVSILSVSSTKPLSLMINQFEAYNMIECAAVIAITILLVNALLKLIFSLIKKNLQKRKKIC